MAKNYRYAMCSTCGLRNCTNGDTPHWTYDAYAKTHALQPEEEYIISRLAQQPTLSEGLDELFRRMPQRWHALMAAAVIKRKEEQAA